MTTHCRSIGEVNPYAAAMFLGTEAMRIENDEKKPYIDNFCCISDPLRCM